MPGGFSATHDAIESLLPVINLPAQHLRLPPSRSSTSSMAHSGWPQTPPEHLLPAEPSTVSLGTISNLTPNGFGGASTTTVGDVECPLPAVSTKINATLSPLRMALAVAPLPPPPLRVTAGSLGVPRSSRGHRNAGHEACSDRGNRGGRFTSQGSTDRKRHQHRNGHQPSGNVHHRKATGLSRLPHPS